MSIPSPELPFLEERAWDLLRTDAPEAAVQRRLRHPNRLRRWTLVWRRATATEKDAIVSEYQTAKGPCGTFSFTPADEGSPVTVRFVEESLRWSLASSTQYRIQFQLEEVLLGTTT